MSKFQYLFAVLGLIGLISLGCSSDDKTPDDKKPVGKSSANGHTGHHAPHGPMNGEVFQVADAGIAIECVPKYGQDLVMFYVYEKDVKTPKQIKCEELTGSYTSGETKTVVIEAINTVDGMASRFEVEDAGFAIARKTTGVKVEFEVDGVKHSVNIPKDPHF